MSKDNVSTIRDALDAYSAQKTAHEEAVKEQERASEVEKCKSVIATLELALSAFFEDAAKTLPSRIAAEAREIKDYKYEKGTEPRRPKEIFSMERPFSTKYYSSDGGSDYDIRFRLGGGSIDVNDKAHMSVCSVVGLSTYKALEDMARDLNVKLSVVFNCEEPHDTYPNEVKEREFSTEFIMAGRMGRSSRYDIRSVEVRLDVSKPYGGLRL